MPPAARPIQYLTVPVEDVFTGIGTVYHDHPAESRLRPARPFDRVGRYGLMLYWPKKDGWLTADVVARPSAAAPEVRFAATREAAEAVCRQHGADPRSVAPANFLAACEFRVGSLTADAAVTLRLAVDTSADGFRAAVLERADAAKGELLVPLSVRLFDATSLGTYFEQTGVVQLVLRPARPVPAYYGVVALDLGNTSTDLACVSRRDPVGRTASLKLLDAEPFRPALADNPNPVPSELNLTRVVSLAPAPPGVRRFPTLPEDDLPRAVEYGVGRQQTFGRGDGVVLGAKRRVSGAAADGYLRLAAAHSRGPDQPDAEEEVEVQNRVPAELLAARVLEKFRTAARAWPAELAVTYPTTYTPPEIDRLARAVERGWLRMQGYPQRLGSAGPADDPTLARLVSATQARLAAPEAADAGDPGVIRLLLDEATAAAFYYVYRKAFESPGGLLRFRYLYPAGMNVLLYDIGGGTTDIALVRATAVGPRHLRIGVLGRTGLRGFGGDEMTRAVARLLKAKLLAELLRARGKAPPPPPARTADPAAARDALAQYVRKVADLDPDDRLLPTRFPRDRTDADARDRRGHARDLHRWADALKVQIGKAGSARFAGLLPHTDPLHRPAFDGLSDAQAKALDAQLKAVTVARWEVDALIDAADRRDGRPVPGPLTRSVDKCNGLIQEVLRDGPAAAGGPEADVHWVVLTGNAARYPLVRERMAERLQVADAADRITLDEENLKHAVAKGAALFLVTTRTPGLQVVVDTETDLSACLPFDVGYFDLGQRKHRRLFRERTRYADAAPRTVPVAGVVGADRAADMRTFFLERRFPGDDEYSRYLAFEFPDGIRGDLRVWYDPAAQGFAAVDGSGMAGTARDLTDEDVYLAPAERGDV